MSETLAHSVGLMHRELKDARSIMANVQHLVRKFDQPQAMHRPAGLTARFAACSVIARVTRQPLDAVVRQHFRNDRDLAQLIELRSISSPASTTVTAWAGDLVATIIADVGDNLLPQTALAQLRALGLQYVFTSGGIARVPMHTPTPSGAFVGEGGPIPIAALILSAINLKPKKAAAITAITREMTQGSPVNVEQTLRALLADDIGLMIDSVLLGNTAATTAAPAGLLNGLTTLTPSTGGGLGAVMGDMKNLLNAISPAIRPVLIMNATQAAGFALLAPNVTVPMIIAPAMAASTVAAIDAAAFASALGLPVFDISDDPVVHEETAPLPIVGGVAQPPVIGSIAAPQRSLWQTNAIGIRTLIDCDWTLRRANAVAFVTGTTW